LVAVLATGAALLTHREGAALLIALPSATLIILWLRRGQAPSVISLQSLGGIFFLIVVTLFMFIYEPSNAMPLIAFHGGQDPEHVGLNIGLGNWASHLIQLQWAFPYGLSVLPVAVFLTIRSMEHPFTDDDYGYAYTLLVFIFSAIMLVTFVNSSAARFWLLSLPLFVLVVMNALVLVVPLRLTKRQWTKVKFTGRPLVLLLLLGGTLANLGFISFTLGVSSYDDLLKAGYGWPCQLTLNGRCRESMNRYYEDLHKRLRPQDIIISSNPWVTYYYLGRVDGLLREKIDQTGFSTFQQPTEEYFGIPIIDTRDELLDLLNDERRVWIIADPKARIYASTQTRQFLASQYVSYYSDGSTDIYVNCIESPCGLRGVQPPWSREFPE
jgi:hypothetical protein